MIPLSPPPPPLPERKIKNKRNKTHTHIPNHINLHIREVNIKCVMQKFIIHGFNQCKLVVYMVIRGLQIVGIRWSQKKSSNPPLVIYPLPLVYKVTEMEMSINDTLDLMIQTMFNMVFFYGANYFQFNYSKTYVT